ncbi:unnamed protein product, partial [Amoebophrya sp. A25]|eukprot:GSA25T00001325001.1
MPPIGLGQRGHHSNTTGEEKECSNTNKKVRGPSGLALLEENFQHSLSAEPTAAWEAGSSGLDSPRSYATAESSHTTSTQNDRKSKEPSAKAAAVSTTQKEGRTIQTSSRDSALTAEVKQDDVKEDEDSRTKTVAAPSAVSKPPNTFRGRSYWGARRAIIGQIRSFSATAACNRGQAKASTFELKWLGWTSEEQNGVEREGTGRAKPKSKSKKGKGKGKSTEAEGESN